MHLLILLGLFVLAYWAFPAGVRYLLIAPLLGLALGGFTWGIAAMFLPELITLRTFGAFIVSGIVGSEVTALVTR